MGGETSTRPALCDAQLDALHHTRSEDAVSDLMRRDGCRGARRVGGGGDLGADVKATDPFGRRW